MRTAGSKTINQVVEACCSASTADTLMISEAVILLSQVLLQRAVTAAGRGGFEQANLIEEKLAELSAQEDSARALSLWSPAIAITKSFLAERKGVAALTQLAVALRDAGAEIPLVLSPLPPEKFYGSGRFFSIGRDGSMPTASAGPIWFGQLGVPQFFVSPAVEVILNEADIDVVWPAPVDHGVEQATLENAAASIAKAMDWIQANSPWHSAWISRLIRGFAITEMPEDCSLSSGSYQSRPGVVHVSFPLSDVLVAETLVHEASHQHYLLLNSILPMVGKGDDQMLYSPIKGTHRPLERFLFAYHACFNIWEFFEMAAKNSRPNSELDERRKLMMNYTKVMRKSMESVQDLPPGGTLLTRRLEGMVDLLSAA